MAAFNLINLSGLLLSLRGRPHRGFWPLLRSWLRPHRGISQGRLPNYLGFFQFMHDARRCGKALLGAPVAALAADLGLPLRKRTEAADECGRR